MGIFASVTWPFSHFWAGPGDRANSICDEEVEWNQDVCTWEDYSNMYIIGKHYSIVKQYVLVLDYTQLHFTRLLFETMLI